ncbi:MAG: cache domain-containing protein [Gammaproteobacteria bacterium]|nr:cache domain-containing protein [Gammaproteobacteria bacterium]
MPSIGFSESRSLRHKLLVLVLLPILLIAPATVAFAIFWSQIFSHAQLLNRVNADLVVAYDHFVRLQRDHLRELEQLAGSYEFLIAYINSNKERVENQLAAIRDTTGFTFLHVTDLYGRKIYTPEPFEFETSKRTPLQRKVVELGQAAVGIEIFALEDLHAESVGLAESVHIPLVSTPRAAPTERDAESRAFVVRAIAPIRDFNGTIVGMIDGGVVMNKNYQAVDDIRDLVFGQESLPEGSIGTVAIFLGDVSVSTNVPLESGERALGTRVSDAVRRAVLEDGRTWVDRSFVVNDWYISAYRPVVDVYGRRVGMLFTGFLEAPFRHAYLRTLAISLALVFVGVGFAAMLAIRGAKTIFKPIEDIVSVVRALQAGDEDKRIGDVASKDEIGELAREFDRTLDLLKLRNEEIRHAAERLETKVEERTRELKEKNVRLEETISLLHATRQQLVSAEKLAALGELTAGVAHEINNPIAVIQGNLELLRHELGDEIGPVEIEINLIMEQIERIHTIVNKLLSYSRPATQRGLAAEVDLRRLIKDTLLLVEHELNSKQLSVKETHDATTPVRIDARELQQVLVNLLVNAAQASSRRGKIDISTRDWDDRGVVISIRDHGEGIPESHLDRVFDPFFTTKRSGGTGLGLSVSFGLVKAYGGDLKVMSTPGGGATFEVYLLKTPVLSDAFEAESGAVEESTVQRAASQG